MFENITDRLEGYFKNSKQEFSFGVQNFQGITMQTIQVQLPDTVNIDAQEIQILLAGKLYEKGLLSAGQAAEMAGFSKRAFMELLGRYEVSVLNYPADDILQDFEHA